jgi:histidinol-phosphate aminotransferase
MDSATVSRRTLLTSAAAAVGGALLEPTLGGSVAEARLFPGVPTDVIQLNANESPYGPSAAAREAMTRAQEIAGRYPGNLEEELAVTLASLHGVTPEQVVLGCGSGEILRMAAAAFLGPGRTLVAAEPTFEAVLRYAGVTAAEPIAVPLDAAFRHDLSRMAAACDARTGLVYVCNPNNPTGTIVTGEALSAFLGRVPPTATVLLDEAYFHFVDHPAYRSGFELLGRLPNLVVVRTFSKIYGLAGMRLGYAVGAPDRIAALDRHRLINNANAAVLTAALATIGETEHVARLKRRMNDTRRSLVEALERDGRRVIPSEANFVMFETGRDVTPLIAALRERKILVGRRFPSMPTWLRVSVGTPEEIAAFLAALRKILPVDRPTAG